MNENSENSLQTVARWGRNILIGIGVGYLLFKFVNAWLGAWYRLFPGIRRTERKRPFSSLTTARLYTVDCPPQNLGQASSPPTTPRNTGEAYTTPTNNRARPTTTADLIQQLRAIDWFQFEKIVALAYRKLGFTVTRRGGANPDGGIDLVIEKVGQRSAVQCKHWKTWNVGVKAVREFLGALTDAGIPKGIFITLGGYTSEAKQLADKHSIEIVNEVGLARMIEDSDARFDPETLDILTDTRKFCPKCERELVLRTAQKGVGVGSKFWGCSAYPKCRFTMQV